MNSTISSLPPIPEASKPSSGRKRSVIETGNVHTDELTSALATDPGLRSPAPDIPLWQRLESESADPQAAEDGNATEPEKKPQSVRFRSLARMIKTNLLWAKDFNEKTHEEEVNEAFVVNMNTNNRRETLTFDASQYKAKDRSYGGLTIRTRRILIKHPLDRTDDELILLRDVVDRLKCFNKYPNKVKNAMSKIIFYEQYSNGRVIIQQGQQGSSCYFIVTGTVEVFVRATDKSGLKQTQQMLGELSEGSSFGELALMHNVTRSATIVCKGNIITSPALLQ